MKEEFKLKEQNVEILSFAEFEKEIRNADLEYHKRQISGGDYERLQKAIKDNDVVECSAIIKSWNIDLDDISSGMLRRSVLFYKNKDGSYKLYNDERKTEFSSNQVLFILENGTVIPISVYQKDFLIARL